MRGRWIWAVLLASTCWAADPAPASRAEPPSAEAAAAYRQALEQKKAKALDKAVDSARHAIELTPGYVDAHNLLAWLHVSRDERERAIAEFRAVIRLAPDSALATEAKAALDRWKVPYEEPKPPTPPTPPVTPPVAPPVAPPVVPNPPVNPPTTPTNPPVKPAVVQPNAPGAIDPNDPDIVWAPKEDRPPAGLATLSTPELFKRCADQAAARQKDKKYDEALCLYRHLLVLDPTNETWRLAVDTLRGLQPERHDLVKPQDQLFARSVLGMVRPATDLKVWPRFERTVQGSELRMLLDPRVVGDARYGILRYAGCDPYVPVVLFTTPPKISVQALRELAGTPQVEAKTWDEALSVLTWGHMRVLVGSDGQVQAVLRKMGDPTPDEPGRGN